jgi:hypothetical protein
MREVGAFDDSDNLKKISLLRSLMFIHCAGERVTWTAGNAPLLRIG